ncbi:MAG: SHOCT domain-containing protein [Mogibacterium sp.]|nr:SHOCT domain-containing protein [Mogibacterium sp.]
MKTCLVCGAENKDKNKYCNKCGTKFPIETVIPEVSPFAAAEPVQAKPETIINGYAFDDEPDSIVREEAVNTQDFDMQAFENEETAIIDTASSVSDFENEETMILDDQQGPSSQTFEQPAPELQAFDMQAFENEETAIIDTASSVSDFENEETMIIDDQQGPSSQTFEQPASGVQEEPPKAPNFSYAGEIPVYRDPQNDVEPDTAYIDHLRRLKGLLDDGIINEREYEQKKEQILGLHAEQTGQK